MAVRAVSPAMRLASTYSARAFRLLEFSHAGSSKRLGGKYKRTKSSKWLVGVRQVLQMIRYVRVKVGGVLSWHFVPHV